MMSTKQVASLPFITQADTSKENDGKASLFSCATNLCATIIGAGMLGLPGAFAGTGYVTGTILLVLGAYFSTNGLRLLAMASEMSGIPASFYTVAHAALPQFTMLIDLAVGLKCFGVATGYFITVGDCMVQACWFLLQLNDNDKDNDNDSSNNGMLASMLLSRQFWVVVAFTSVLPLSFYRTLDELKVVSALSLLLVMALAGVIVAYAHGYADPCQTYGQVLLNDDDDLYNSLDDLPPCQGPIVLSTTLPNIAQKLPIFVFAFTCQQNIFPVVNEIQHRTQTRIDYAIYAAVGLALLIYAIVAMEGYNTYGAQLQGDVLLNYPQTTLVTGMRICIAFMVVFHYPLQLDPSRRCFMSLVVSFLSLLGRDKDDEEEDTWEEEEVGKVGCQDGKWYKKASTVSTLSCSPKPNHDNHNHNHTYEGTNAASPCSPSKTSTNYSSMAPTTTTTTTTTTTITTTKPKPLTHQKRNSSQGHVLSTSKTEDSRLFYSVTILFLTCSFIIAMLVEDLGNILAVVGATGSTIVSYILPGAIYIKLCHKKGKEEEEEEEDYLVGGYEYWLAVVQLGLGCLIMPTALYFLFASS